MKRAFPLTIAVLAFLALAGVSAVVWQTREGLGVTAMREPVVWGLCVVGFAYFLGLGAGALTIAGAAVASRRAEFRQTARIASPLAPGALVLAGLMITLDLGRPERAWMLAAKAQFQSPLVIDFLVLNAMLTVALVLAYFNFRLAVRSRSQPLPRLLALPFTIGSGTFLARRAASLVQWLAVLTTIAVPASYLLTVRVFASLQARPAWHSPLLAPSFLASAMLAGVFVKRWHVIVSGMSVRNLPLEDGIYSPNLVEITAIVGITAGAVLVLVVLLSVFRSADREDDLKANSIAAVRPGASLF